MASDTEKKQPQVTQSPATADTSNDDDFEKLIDGIGGHGPFQALIWTVSFGTKASVAGVFLFMSFAGTTPDFWCIAPSAWGGDKSSAVGGLTSEAFENGVRSVSDGDGWKRVWNLTNSNLLKACEVNGTTACWGFRFEDNMNTIVSEWTLVCDKKWVSTTITSVQMAGVLLGALAAGQMADIWGRRKICIALLIGQFALSLGNAFSPDWIVFIITRLGAGFCAGGYLVPYFSLTMEFTDVQWRAFLGAIPAWPIGAGLMALAAWLLHDWQYLGIAIACLTLPFLLGWWFVMPESVRWLLVHDRVPEAQAILCRAAKRNGRPEPDEKLTRKLASAEVAKAKSNRFYSFLDLFRSRDLAKRTSLLLFVWFSSGAIYYFLAFGAENLSGNLYFNIFLLSTVEAPAMFLSAFLNNRIGRRWTAFSLYMGAGVCTIIVIILINTGTAGSAVNGVVITAKLAMGGGWAAVIVFSAENFPTVVRNIGYGALNMASKVGAIVAPQLVFMYDTHPSVPYAVVSVLMVGSSLCFLQLRETKDRALEDVLPTGRGKTDPDTPLSTAVDVAADSPL